MLNFFSHDDLRNTLARRYEQLVTRIVTALDHLTAGTQIPRPLNVDFCGYQITFTLPAEHDSPEATVTIDVSRNGKTASAGVNNDVYRRICTHRLICQRNGLPAPDLILMTNHYTDLQGVNLRHADLQQAYLPESNLQHADLQYTR